jgi:hypothetical protein
MTIYQGNQLTKDANSIVTGESEENASSRGNFHEGALN